MEEGNGTTREDFVRVEGLDRDRILRLDTNAICDFDDLNLGTTVIDAVYGAGRMSLGTIRALLWAGFKHEDKRLTRQRVAMLIEEYVVKGGKIQDLADWIIEAADRSRLLSTLLGAVDPNAQRGAGTTSPTSPTSEPGSPDNG